MKKNKSHYTTKKENKMSANNNAKRATIAEIQDKFFEIPPYQRLYEWESAQIEELLNDIQKAFETNKEKEYFIGNITTSKKVENKKEIYVLIDGQQRLTTLWFIGFYLASRGCDSWKDFILQGENLRIAMPIRDNEKNALEKLAKEIQGEIKPNENGELNLCSHLPNDIHKKIISAFDCIEKWFNAKFGKYENNKLAIDSIQLNRFVDFIYNQVCFVFVALAEKTDLNRFFVRMNNRGKQLEKHEILKARILQKIDKNEQEKYAKIWNLCSDMDKYIFQSASDRKMLDSSDESGEKWNIDKIIKEYDNTKTKDKNANDDSPSKVESIIDFPTFLLHCYKLWATKKCKDKIDKITITKDKLLDIFEKNDNAKWDSESCKWFIIDMLYYRVLFDYFVIKNDTNIKQGNAFRIRRLESYKSRQNTYYRLPDDNKSVSDNSPLKALATLQNYLRVARQGEKQNYHHWLTPFLQKLYEAKLINYDWLKIESWNPDEICKVFESKDESKQNELVSFLENLDIKLAMVQLNKTNENDLLGTTNEILQGLNKVKEPNDLDSVNWDFLNKGTATPHYWFYRLEYYLWKNGVENDENLQIGGKNFSDIRKNFYFRNLNSIEHIQPQSKAEENDWQIHDKDTQNQKIDCFGNLALVSVGFNSTLNNQSGDDKRLDLQKKINKDDVESLKLWLVYAQYIKDSDKWTYEDSQTHQESMIEILKESLKSQDSQDSKQ